MLEEQLYEDELLMDPWMMPGMGPMPSARLMVKHDIGRLPVVEDGKIIGIVTRSDTMRYYYDLLPE